MYLSIFFSFLQKEFFPLSFSNILHIFVIPQYS
nr:MAG TPA: hypothetical protein [Bacteriophage sp.]